MSSSSSKDRGPSQATLDAAAAAKRTKAAVPDTFGLPELFIVKAGERGFTWELRRFGGILLQRGPEVFDSAALARSDGETALAALRSSPDLPTFKRSPRP